MDDLFVSNPRSPSRALCQIGSILLGFFLTGCGAVLPQRSEGEKLYRKHCAECHGVDGAGQTLQSMGDNNADLLDQSWRHGLGPSGIETVLSQDLVFKHPTFSRKLSSEQIKQIGRHVRKLRGES